MLTDGNLNSGLTYTPQDRSYRVMAYSGPNIR